MFLGLKKKLAKLAKEKDCSDLALWIRSIINHLYHIAANIGNEPPPEGSSAEAAMMDRWLSLKNHIHNLHLPDTPGNRGCEHGVLDGNRKKKWLKEGKKIEG